MEAEPAEAAQADAASWRGASPRVKVETAIIVAGFVLYAVFLLKLLLFSRVPGSERSLNLVPFATIAGYAAGHTAGVARVAFANVAGNVLVFIPLGLYLAWFRRRRSAWVTLLAVASFSVGIELVQWVFAVGATDIDDVILNSVGGLLGILAVWVISAALRTRSRARTAIAMLSLISAPVWCYFAFVIRLHI